MMIGLTATPFHGKSQGIEATALDMMGYKLYSNNTSIKVSDPTINERVKLGSLAQWENRIQKLRLSQPVLIYATGQPYSELCTLEFVLPVTEETETA